MPTQKAIILHAWYSNSKFNWYPWLKKELEKKGYKVYLPELPTMNTDLPDMALQLKTIQNAVDIDEDTTVIGHSLACLLAMRLAERKKYKKMVLVAGWDINDLTVEHRLVWPSKINHTKIKENVEEIYCLSSDND